MQSNQKISKKCVICYDEIDIPLIFHDSLHFNQRNNYGKCLSDHFIHINPCLEQWILSSKNCPVCSNQYPDSLLQEMEGFVKSTQEMEKKQIEKEKAQIVFDQIVSDLKKQEQKTEIIIKIDYAKHLISEGKFVESLRLLFEIVDNHDPGNKEVMFLIGKVRYLEERFDLSISNYMKLVKLDHDYPFAFYYLGKSYEQLGLKDKAIWAFERSINSFYKLIEVNDDPHELAEFQKYIEELTKILKN